MSVIWNIEFVSLHLSTGSNSTERDTFHISITCDHTRQGHCYYTGCMPATSKVIFKLKSTDDFVSWPTMLVGPEVHPSSLLCRNVLGITCNLFNAPLYWWQLTMSHCCGYVDSCPKYRWPHNHQCHAWYRKQPLSFWDYNTQVKAHCMLT